MEYRSITTALERVLELDSGGGSAPGHYYLSTRDIYGEGTGSSVGGTLKASLVKPVSITV